jgi:hypothetical protein
MSNCQRAVIIEDIIETDKIFQHDKNFHDRFAIGLVVDLRHCRNVNGRKLQSKTVLLFLYKI